jgi:hypothetical protein
VRLFQNFRFWNSFLRFNGKTGLLAGFSKSLIARNNPRTAVILGSDIRLTDGIVSSKSGINADQTYFQHSAPIQQKKRAIKPKSNH